MDNKNYKILMDNEKMAMPFFSVIMLTYNACSIVEKALKGIYNQTFADFELLLINDCSTDNTDEIVKANTDNRLIYVKNDTNQGVGKSRQLGVSLAKGQYIVFADVDDVVDNNLLFELKTEIDKHNTDFIIYGYEERYVNENNRLLWNKKRLPFDAYKECGGENIAFCEIYFTYDLEGKDGTVYQQDLIENGREILVTQDNLDLYIDKRIEYYTKSQMGGIKEIISGINTIFPVEYLKIFTSDQLGLLINGTPFIDTEDWRMNTQYKNYKDYDNVIINFWDIISNLSQEELSNFLLFCTGSSRVPIGGFKSLESNRGQIAKFEIVKTEYIAGKKNYLRAHTCFNRLDLPNFPDKNTLDEAVKFALENEVLGFGIE